MAEKADERVFDIADMNWRMKSRFWGVKDPRLCATLLTWIERGHMDLATDFSIPLPMKVIAEMIGIPGADWPRFKHWSDGILKLENPRRKFW